MMEMERENTKTEAVSSEKIHDAQALSKIYVSADNLIPVLSFLTWTGFCADMVSLNTHPTQWSIGSTCTVCSPFTLCTCQGLKLSDVQSECCLLCEWNYRATVPTTCCSCIGDILFLSFRCTIPKDSNYEHAAIPCNLTLGGCTICIDGNFRFGFLQSIKTLREGKWILPYFPCVLGSCENCAIFAHCATACGEYFASLQNPQKKSSPSGPSRSEVMTRDAVHSAANVVDKFARSIGDGGKEQIGKTRSVDLYPCMGLGCFICSAFTNMPDCMGCYDECAVLCLSSSLTCQKPMVKRGQEFQGDMLLCCSARNALVCPRTLCTCITQHWCLDVRGAFPCDSKHAPCVCNLLFVNCCYDFRPTFHCTWYAPLMQFEHDYKGEKYTVFDMIGFCYSFVSAAVGKCVACRNDPPPLAEMQECSPNTEIITVLQHSEKPRYSVHDQIPDQIPAKRV